MQIRPTAFTIGLIIYSFIALFFVYTEFGIDSSFIIYTSIAYKVKESFVFKLLLNNIMRYRRISSHNNPFTIHLPGRKIIIIINSLKYELFLS